MMSVYLCMHFFIVEQSCCKPIQNEIFQLNFDFAPCSWLYNLLDTSGLVCRRQMSGSGQSPMSIVNMPRRKWLKIANGKVRREL